MPTVRQLLKYSRVKKCKIHRTPALDACPQKRGVCRRVYETTPKKPNSARRKVARIELSNDKFVIGYIPGEGKGKGKTASTAKFLQEHSVILLRGGRVQDVPGVRYHIIRGKFDLEGIKARKRARSKYGTKAPPRAPSKLV